MSILLSCVSLLPLLMTPSSAIDFISPAIRKGVLEGPYSLLVSAALSNNTLIRLHLKCDEVCAGKDILYSLFLRKCFCANEFSYVDKVAHDIFEKPFTCNIKEECSHPVSYSEAQESQAKCPGRSSNPTQYVNLKMKSSDFYVRTIANPIDPTSEKTYVPRNVDTGEAQQKLGYPVAKTWEDGFYIFGFRAKGCLSIEYTLTMEGPKGYLLLDEIPFLKFYRSISWYYGLLALIWFAFCLKYRKELMRIQYFIGLVIVMSYVELIVYAAAYKRFDLTGRRVDSLISAALVLSAARRALSRGLLILVSYGYGIVKPRMGTIYRKVFGLTITYFAAALLENFHLSAMSPEQIHLRSVYLLLPVAILDSIVSVWIFTSLKATLHALRVKRNELKLRIYLRFTICLITVTIVSYIYWLTVVLQSKSVKCIKSVRQPWIETIVWWTISTFLLTVIATLWRPSENNKRYAYTPLLDKYDEDDAEERSGDVDPEGDQIRMRTTTHEQAKVHEPSKATPEAPRLTVAEQILTAMDFEQKADRLMEQLNKIS